MVMAARVVVVPRKFVEQRGRVPAADEQPFASGREEATIDPQRWTPADVPLGVDDEHAGPAHHQVVDVRAGARDTAVVKHPHGRRRDPVQAGTQGLLPDGAALPRAGALGIVTQGQDQPAQTWMCLTDRLLALGLSLIEHATSGGAGHARWDVGLRFWCGGHRNRLAREAADAAPHPGVDGARSGGERCPTESAGTRIPQPDRALVGGGGCLLSHAGGTGRRRRRPSDPARQRSG